MKKIVMGIAAVAMAASMFAADVSAKLVYNTSIYADKAILSAPAASYGNNNTQITFAANGDAAGATIMLTNSDDGKSLADGATIDTFEGVNNLWFKPVDSVKITVGGFDTGSINRGTFAWWHRTVRVGGQGFLVNTNVAGVGLEIASFKGPLLNFNNDGYGILGNFYVNATYGLGDAGNLGFVVTKGADINAYGVGGWEQGVLALCLSYDHMPWQTTGFYADALINLDVNKGAANVLDEVGAQVGGQYVADGLALRLSTMFAWGHKYGAPDATISYGLVAWASYNIDGWEPYVKVVANELDAKKFSVDAGVTKGFGAASIDARFAGSYDGSAFAWSIPCTISCGL